VTVTSSVHAAALALAQLLVACDSATKLSKLVPPAGFPGIWPCVCLLLACSGFYCCARFALRLKAAAAARNPNSSDSSPAWLPTPSALAVLGCVATWYLPPGSRVAYRGAHILLAAMGLPQAFAIAKCLPEHLWSPSLVPPLL